MNLNYQLFNPKHFLSELRSVGFKVHSLKAEGVLPESWLLHSFTTRCLDGLN